MLTMLVMMVLCIESCFHCTYGTSRGMLNNLHAAYPEDIFGLINYPTEIQGIELSEFLHVLSRPSRWKSVNYLKDCLRRCSRDLKWKLDVAVELEVLADKEYEVYTTEKERLGTEIDELTRLRDSFKAKLDKLAAKEGDKKAGNQQYLLLRKLEDIETRLVSLLDTYLQEPELEESECDGMFDGAGAGGDGLARGMNVLDMVVAMIFSRLPRDFSQHMTSEEHFQMLFDHHIHIRRLWKKDFGRLPPRTNAAALYAAESDADSAEEMKTGQDDEQQTYHHESDDDEEFESYESVEAPPAAAGRGFRNGASSSSDSWESVYADEPRGDGNVSEDEEEAVKSDGYGADYDSDESDDDHPHATATASSAVAVPLATLSSTLPRRARSHRPTPLVFSDEEQETTTRMEKKVKSSKKEKERKKKTKTKKKEDAPFQPFACTGALNFLRIAKENEMF